MPSSGDTFNIDIATESFVRGGWFGRGPGEGTIKRILPEGHTDFVFAVAGEEIGVVHCLILVVVPYLVIRALVKAMGNDDAFVRLPRPASQYSWAAIDHQHGREPAPHGGEGNDAAVHFVWQLSLISLAYGMGMLIALTRERPQAHLSAGPMLAAGAA